MLRLPRILHVKKQVNTLITMEGRTGHRRQPQTTADNATARASNLPRILHMEVHKVLRLPRILRVKKQVNTLITMGRTGDHRRQPPTTQRPEPLTEHGGSQSAAPATNSAHGGSQSAAPATNSAQGGSQSAAPATNSARQETSAYSNHNGGTDRRPPQTTADNRRQRNSQSL